MRRIIETLMTVAVAALLLPSCESAAVDGGMERGEGVVLYVADPTSRTSFTDEGTDGINVEWEVGDEFTLYNAENLKVDDFVCKDAASGRFRSEKSFLKLTEGASYTAVYPASLAPNYEEATIDYSEQNSVEIDDLNDKFHMEMNFNYSSAGESELMFEHQTATMTIKYKETGVAKIIFSNGSTLYTINCEGAVPDSEGVYTSHIMIQPCTASHRELNFRFFHNDETEPFEVRATTSKKGYEVGARYTATTYDYATPNKFSGGDGKVGNPYKISTAADMLAIADGVNTDLIDDRTSFSGCYFLLTNDIDLTDEPDFQPIGERDVCFFRGDFDGGGNEIAVNIDRVWDFSALFGNIDKSTIKNLDVSGSVKGKNNTAGIVSIAIGSNIINCRNYAIVTSSDNAAGGIVGRIYSEYDVSVTNITNCENHGSISANGKYVGGVVGYCSAEGVEYVYTNYTIKNCTNSGHVKSIATTLEADAKVGVGGIVGYTKDNIKFEQCVNKGVVEMSGNYDCAGGIIGYAQRLEANMCSNEGAVSGGSYVGGIVGHANAARPIINCRNIANITETKGTYKRAGGIAGQINMGEIANCYNSGGITDGILGAGIISEIRIVNSNTFSLKNCYSSGTSTYGVINAIDESGDSTAVDVQNCYYNTAKVDFGLGRNFGDLLFSWETSEIYGLSTAEMTGDKLINSLNDFDYAIKDSPYCEWRPGEGGYPDLFM